MVREVWWWLDVSQLQKQEFDSVLHALARVNMRGGGGCFLVSDDGPREKHTHVGAGFCLLPGQQRGIYGKHGWIRAVSKEAISIKSTRGVRIIIEQFC